MQKALGLFGGNGFARTVRFFESMGMPFILATLVIPAEYKVVQDLLPESEPV